MKQFAICVAIFLLVGCSKPEENPWKDVGQKIDIKVVQLETGERVLLTTSGSGAFRHVAVTRLDDAE